MVNEALTVVVKKHGMEAAKVCMQRIGLDALANLKEAHYAPLHAICVANAEVFTANDSDAPVVGAAQTPDLAGL